MARSPLAGKPAPAQLLINIDQLIRNYYDLRPDPADPLQRVALGTSPRGRRPGAIRFPST